GTMNGGTDNQANIAAWRTALPADNFSGYSDVSFVLANGTSSTMNLIPSSSVNLFSAPLPNITVDYRS
ncbi:MAG TPA: hypothetical protein DCQ29_06120, partial [Chitinophagaceae bacterium]|nr:hypothetical protein [Chitinophagaceae bacterium]